MPEDLRCGHMISDDEGAAYRCAILVNAAGEHGGEHYFKREMASRVAPIAPDSERDRRRAAYAALQRESVRRALDAWFRAIDERDYALANELLNRVNQRMGEYEGSPTAHKSHYGAPGCDCPLPEKVSETCPIHGDKWARMVPHPHPMSNCGPLTLKLNDGDQCPTCGTVVHRNAGVANSDYRSSGTVEANPPHDQDCPCRECTHNADSVDAYYGRTTDPMRLHEHRNADSARVPEFDRNGCPVPHSVDYVADLADSDCLRLTERAEYCPAFGSPRCESCVWRPADGPRPA